MRNPFEIMLHKDLNQQWKYLLEKLLNSFLGHKSKE